jgi:hypothetical protein
VLSVHVHVHIQAAENPGGDLAKLRCVWFGKRKINSQILRGDNCLLFNLLFLLRPYSMEINDNNPYKEAERKPQVGPYVGSG